MKTEIIDIHEEEYRAIDCLSVTQVRDYLVATSDYAFSKKNKRPGYDAEHGTEAMVVGDVLDYIVTYGKMPEIIESEAKTYNSKKHHECMQANGHNKNNGRFVLTENMTREVSMMYNSVKDHKIFMDFTAGSSKQLKLLRTNNEGKPVLKGMIDLFHEEQKRIIDTKKIDKLSSWRFRSQDMGYWYQVAAYSYLMNEVRPGLVETAGFFVVESRYPYEIYMPIRGIAALAELFKQFEMAMVKLKTQYNPGNRTSWVLEG